MLKRIPQSRIFQLLEPGPVVLLVTSRQGRANAMAMSWHMMMEFEPPLVGCIVSGRNHSFAVLKSTRQCVIAVPTVELAREVVGIGNCSGRKVDKLAKFGLTALPAETVEPPLIAECFANLECRVADARLVDRYNMFVLEVLSGWRDPKRKRPRTIHHHGYGSFVVDGPSISLRSRMR